MKQHAIKLYSHSQGRRCWAAAFGLAVLSLVLVLGVAVHARAGEKKAIETATFALG